MNLFISYSHEDQGTVEQLVARLRRFGHDPWIDEELHGRGGQLWWDTILNQIERADICLLALSPNWIDSEMCTQEFDYAESLERNILPVVVLGTRLGRLPLALQQRQLIDFTQPSMDCLGDLVTSIDRIGSAPPLPSPMPPRPLLPETDLFRIRRDLSSTDFLNPTRQFEIFTTLKQFVERPKQRDDAKELLIAFKGRGDITRDFDRQVEALLVELNQTSANPVTPPVNRQPPSANQELRRRVSVHVDQGGPDVQQAPNPPTSQSRIQPKVYQPKPRYTSLHVVAAVASAALAVSTFLPWFHPSNGSTCNALWCETGNSVETAQTLFGFAILVLASVTTVMILIRIVTMPVQGGSSILLDDRFLLELSVLCLVLILVSMIVRFPTWNSWSQVRDVTAYGYLVALLAAIVMTIATAALTRRQLRRLRVRSQI
jgi:TIR domain